MNALQRLYELAELRKLHLHQLQNKAMAPFCAASKQPVEPDLPPQVEDRMAPCHNCGQFRACSVYNGEWYCKVKCSARAKRGVLSRKRAQDIPPRSGR